MRGAVGWSLGICLAARGLWGQVVINEVGFDEPTGSPDWVELFNAGTAPVALDGWAIDDGDSASGKQIFLSSGLVLPSHNYLVVMVDAAGAPIGDFSNGFMTVFSGTATTVNLAATEDQVALYWKTPLSSATLVDFVSWVTDGDYGGATDRTQQAAVAAGLWPEEGVVELPRNVKGQSVGRRHNGRRSQSPADFQHYSHSTRGTSNEPAPSPYSAVLTVEPSRQSFSPHDPDPLYRTTSLYFNTDAEAVKSLKIVDLRGRAVRRLLESDREVGGVDFAGVGTGHVDWDGRDDAGSIVSMGLYIVLFEATERSSGHTERRRAKVAVGRP